MSAQAPASAQLPAAADRPVSFATDIKPILQVSCVRCHGRGRSRGGFSIETRELLLKGGEDGQAVVLGKSAESHLIAMVAGLDPDEVMPKKGSRLTSAQVGLLRAWIDQGLPWDADVTFAKAPPRNLTPRAPELPVTTNETANPVDRLLSAYFAAHETSAAPRTDDRTFIRRASLDIVGLLPSPFEIRTFVTDTRSDKRERLVARLLQDDGRYATHWLSFWNDLLRNDYRGTGYIDGGREQISAWLYASLANNLPYDQFVRALIDPSAPTNGFTKGIVWRGVVNASQTPQMQAAQNVSQVFMGVNLKCASCHDSFINDWQLSDAYGLAGIYADGPLEMVECDRPTGKTAPMKFLYNELGTVNASGPRAARLTELAHLLTASANGRLPRTIVNRLWARFMGRGLVEPLDDMDQPAWQPDLLDWLAEDLVAHGYNIKRTIGVILTSSAYQRVAMDLAERQESYVFKGPALRRLSAEQFVDAVSAVTGVWQKKVEGTFDFSLVSAHAAPAPLRVRAAMVASDPLMTALGRPNREQVVTTRASAPTTLQLLELQNGATLATELHRGAEHLAARGQTSPQLVDTIFLRALGRKPTAPERSLALATVGTAPSVSGTEDLLWSIVMLPEFEVIH
jgi:mono/diheme cytochrome c family protein